MFDVLTVLEALGIEYEEKANDALALCPMHERITGKADNNPSWWINTEAGQHICFSCGYKGSLVQLVCDVKEFYLDTWGHLEYDYATARAWLSTVAEISMDRLAEILSGLPQYIKSPPAPLTMSEARLAVFVQAPADALEGRLVSAEAAETYGVLWNAQSRTWILPLREPHTGTLLGWQEKGTVDRTFKNRPTGLTKSKTLFGVDQQTEDLVVVVESPLDCLRLATAGVEGAVAICGSSISEDQVKLLRYSGKIVCAFDNPNIDTAGKKASAEMLKWGRKYGLNLFYFNYGDLDKKDPGDMTDEEIAWGIANAKSAILGESAYVQRNAQTVSG
jgi:hypothetical protein